MLSRRTSRIAATLAITVAGCAPPPAAPAVVQARPSPLQRPSPPRPDAPAGTLTYQSFLGARRALDASIDAHGGADALKDTTIPYVGTLTVQGHYRIPGSLKEHPVRGAYILSRRLQAVMHHGEMDEGKLKTEMFCGADQTQFLDYGESKPAPLSPVEAARRCSELRGVLPGEILLRAGARSPTLRWLGEAAVEGAACDVITFSEADGEVTSLYLDQRTHLLVRAERLASHGQWGDSVTWVAFRDYHPEQGLMLPGRRIERLLAEDEASMLDIRLGPFALNAGLALDALPVVGVEGRGP